MRLSQGVTMGALVLATHAPAPDHPRPDETVVVFPVAASLDESVDRWRIPVRGWIFEPEADDALRGALLESFADALGLGGRESELFCERAAMFVVDNERGKRIGVSAGGATVVSSPSEASGHFSAVIELPSEAEPAVDRWERLSVAVQPEDDRSFVGRAQLLAPDGVSVICDLDDTLRVSEVRDGRRLLERTFLEPWEPVPGMPAEVAALGSRGAALHYVSASPWQLYPTIAGFLREHGIPDGSFHLKDFRWKDQTFLSLFQDPVEYKTPIISALLDQFPQRRFILIGDSGERDPEVYAWAARARPKQVEAVVIRLVPGDRAEDARFARAFEGVEPERVLLFTDAADIAAFPAIKAAYDRARVEPPHDQR